MASATATVRIKQETQNRLRQLARERGTSMTTVLEEAIDAYARKVFFDEVNAAFARLRAQPEAWEDELEERRLWDATLLDGLKDD